MKKRNPIVISKTMRAVKSQGSKIEVRLCKALWKNGYRYRKNVKTIYGKPDVVFKNIKLAIFVDSEFWHGKDWHKRKFDHKSNKKYWYNKIEGNIARDLYVSKTLRAQGWQVLRFWGEDIEKKLTKCVDKIERTIKNRKTL